jgi:hypothetical protein
MPPATDIAATSTDTEYQRPRRQRYVGGVALPRGLDARSVVGRRFKALVRHYGEILGDPSPSEADCSLIRRCASQAVRLEQMDAERLAGHRIDEDAYIRLSGELRRGEATLGRHMAEA